MNLNDEYEPVILLNVGESFSGLDGCQRIAMRKEEAGPRCG
jgi:hypothetical protein